MAIKPSPLASLHVHRRVLGVIGILHCPLAPDLDKAYSQFQQLCRYLYMQPNSWSHYYWLQCYLGVAVVVPRTEPRSVATKMHRHRCVWTVYSVPCWSSLHNAPDADPVATVAWHVTFAP